jgi:N-acetyl-anhydromuramyl-L-alanine amidase AmpD
VHKKERIVLHFTAGQLRSDLEALTRHDFHVSVAFVIARSGVIYQLFPSKFWSGHIGKGIGNIGTGNAEDKKTIGIELSNYGFLTEHDQNLETIYSRQKDKNGNPVLDVYCTKEDKTAYRKLATPFRRQSYYATHTNEQYDSLIVLLRYLTEKFNIPRQFLPEPVRYEATQRVLTFQGIVSHINYREDGKWDIGQAFDWETVIRGVQAAEYKPLSSQFENTGGDGGFEGVGIQSEDDLEVLAPEAADPFLENEPYEERDHSQSEAAR